MFFFTNATELGETCALSSEVFKPRNFLSVFLVDDGNHGTVLHAFSFLEQGASQVVRTKMM